MKALMTFVLVLLIHSQVFAKDVGNKLSTSPSEKVIVKDTWKQFTSSEGRFSALFPNYPTEEIKTINSAAGPLDTHIFSANEGDDFFTTVAYVDVPGISIHPVSTQLDAARDGMIKNTQGKLLSEKTISLGDYPGRELVVELLRGPYVMVVVARVYMVKDRQYSAQVVTLKKSLSKTVWRFLDSFNVTATFEELFAEKEEAEYIPTQISRLLSSAKDMIQQTSLMIIRAAREEYPEDGRIPIELNGVKSTAEERVLVWRTTLIKYQNEVTELEDKIKKCKNFDNEEVAYKLVWEAHKLESAIAGFSFRVGVVVGIQELVPVQPNSGKRRKP